MKRARINPGAWLTCSLLLLVAVIPCVQTWLAWRQGERNGALLAAIDRNDTLTAVSLLEQGADANAREEMPQRRSFLQILLSALHLRYSVAAENSPALLRLLEPLPASANGDGSGMHFRPENAQLVSALLEHGADMERRSTAFDHHDNALLWAACSGKAATVKLLVRHGADLNTRNDFGSTPLMEAVWNGEEKTVQALVDLGADVSIRDRLGVSPLREAETYEMKSIARVLRKAGAKR